MRRYRGGAAALLLASLLIGAPPARATPLTENGALTTQGAGLAIAKGGVGLEALGGGSANINVTIPAGATVERALLYWAGRDFVPPCPPGCDSTRDQDLIFDGNPISGTLIGEETQFPPSTVNNIGFRADVTAIVQAAGTGALSFSIQDGDLAKNLGRLNGAGLLVIYSDPADPTFYRVSVFEGLDFAFNRTDQLAAARVTDPVVLNHVPTGFDRTAELVVFAGDADAIRGDRIDITDGFAVTTSLVNQLAAVDGAGFDTLSVSVNIPAAGATTTVQLLSTPPGTNPEPDSLLWALGALRVPLPEPNIIIVKQLSIDGGATFQDADNPGDVVTTAPSDAEYRLIVRNTGAAVLENVVINDAELGIMNFPVGTLNPGQEVVLTSGDIPELFVPNRCGGAGDFFNEAVVEGFSLDTGQTVSDSDPAWLRCEERLQCIVNVSKKCLVLAGGGDGDKDKDKDKDKDGDVGKDDDKDKDKDKDKDGDVGKDDDKDKDKDKDKDTDTPGTPAEACTIKTAGGAEVEYTYEVSNIGAVAVTDVTVIDDILGPITGSPIASLGVGESVTLSETAFVASTTTNTVTVTANSPFSICEATDTVTVTVEEKGGEGCTPGFWKQGQHFDSWTAPLAPSTLFSDVFENAFPGKTLLEVLGLGGGDLDALGRHTVAALLNAASPDVSYNLSQSEVINSFNNVFPSGDLEAQKNVFEGFNEQGCPLGGDGDKDKDKDKDDDKKKSFEDFKKNLKKKYKNK